MKETHTGFVSENKAHSGEGMVKSADNENTGNSMCQYTHVSAVCFLSLSLCVFALVPIVIYEIHGELFVLSPNDSYLYATNSLIYWVYHKFLAQCIVRIERLWLTHFRIK